MHVQRWIAAALSAAALGCGDDDGVSGTQRVGDLSPSEVESVCKEVDAKFTRLEKAFVKVTCTILGQLSPTTCESARAQCIEDTPSSGSLDGMIDFACSGTPDAITQICPDVTVGELQGCLEGIIDTIEAAVGQYGCDASATFDSPATPKACTDLGTRCAQLADFSLE